MLPDTITIIGLLALTLALGNPALAIPSPSPTKDLKEPLTHTDYSPARPRSPRGRNSHLSEMEYRAEGWTAKETRSRVGPMCDDLHANSDDYEVAECIHALTFYETARRQLEVDLKPLPKCPSIISVLNKRLKLIRNPSAASIAKAIATSVKRFCDVSSGAKTPMDHLKDRNVRDKQMKTAVTRTLSLDILQKYQPYFPPAEFQAAAIRASSLLAAEALAHSVNFPKLPGSPSLGPYKSTLAGYDAPKDMYPTDSKTGEYQHHYWATKTLRVSSMLIAYFSLHPDVQRPSRDNYIYPDFMGSRDAYKKLTEEELSTLKPFFSKESSLLGKSLQTAMSGIISSVETPVPFLVLQRLERYLSSLPLNSRKNSFKKEFNRPVAWEDILKGIEEPRPLPTKK